MTRPVLITGAAGFAGSHLLDQLLEEGGDIVAWFHPSAHPAREVKGVRWQSVELLDREAVRAAVADVRPSQVYHLAGAAHVGQSWDTTRTTLRTNVIGTHHIVEALRSEAPDARLMITSSALVYGPSPTPISEAHPLAPDSPYGLSKVAQEMVGLGNDGVPVVLVARPFNHFGPRQDPAFVSAAFAQQIAEIEAGRKAPEIAVGNLEARRDLTDVRDTVRAYRLIMKGGAPLRPYNICTGRAVAVQTLLDMMIVRARTPVRVVRDPARYRPNDAPMLAGDSSRIRDELGWTASIPLEQTIDDLLEYWRSRTAAAR